MELTDRQKQTLLKIVYDKLFGFDTHIKSLEKDSEGNKDLQFHIGKLKEDLDDLRIIKDKLSAEVYKGVYN